MAISMDVLQQSASLPEDTCRFQLSTQSVRQLGRERHLDTEVTQQFVSYSQLEVGVPLHTLAKFGKNTLHFEMANNQGQNLAQESQNPSFYTKTASGRESQFIAPTGFQFFQYFC